MILESPDGNLFTLVVEGYEFPDEELGPTEDNPADEFDRSRFLIVSHTFRNADGAWNACFPTMDTSELLRFRNWLVSLQARKPTAIGVYFTERDLEFSVDHDCRILLVHVSGDFLPAWGKFRDSIAIEFPLTSINFENAIISLDEQLARFPEMPPLQ